MADELGVLPYPQVSQQPNRLQDYVDTINLLSTVTQPQSAPQAPPSAPAAQPPSSGYMSPEGFYVPPQAMAPAPQADRVDPIWPTSNPVGTERFVDYRGWDQGVQPRTAPETPIGRALAPAPNTEYASVWPWAKDTTTGEWRWAMPSSARSFLQGGYDLAMSPTTGTVTPEATMTLASLAAPDLFRTNEGGVIRTFAGPRAVGADLDRMTQAQTLEKAGATRDDIWDQTGWFRAPDGNWKFEIPDEGMRANPNMQVTPSGETTLGEAIEHPELFKAYPELQRTDVFFGKLPPGSSAAYYPPIGEGDPGAIGLGARGSVQPSSLVHEMQHAVQRIEDWPTGASPQATLIDPQLRAELTNEVERRIKAVQTPLSYEEYVQNTWGGDPTAATPGGYQQYLRETKKPITADSALGKAIMDTSMHEVYKRVSGEVEARAAGARWKMPPDVRQDVPPWYDWDVPPEQQIVRRPRRREP